jgi:hypothetical protein
LIPAPRKVAGAGGTNTTERVLAFDSRRMPAYLDGHPSEAEAIERYLTLGSIPVSDVVAVTVEPTRSWFVR